MGLKDKLKKMSNDNDNQIIEDKDGETNINVGAIFDIIKKKKSGKQ